MTTFWMVALHTSAVPFGRFPEANACIARMRALSRPIRRARRIEVVVSQRNVSIESKARMDTNYATYHLDGLESSRTPLNRRKSAMARNVISTLADQQCPACSEREQSHCPTCQPRGAGDTLVHVSSLKVHGCTAGALQLALQIQAAPVVLSN